MNPLIEGYEQFFALGTYQVEKDESKESFTDDQRYGKLHLFESKLETNDFQVSIYVIKSNN